MDIMLVPPSTHYSLSDWAKGKMELGKRVVLDMDWETEEAIVGSNLVRKMELRRKPSGHMKDFRLAAVGDGHPRKRLQAH